MKVYFILKPEEDINDEDGANEKYSMYRRIINQFSPFLIDR